VAERIKLAFASGSADLIPTLLEKMAGIHPELPLHLISQFPSPNAGVPWIRWIPANDLSDNTARLKAAVAGKEVVLAGIILQPHQPFWSMRWTAARRWPMRLMVYNENLDHFMLRPQSLPAIAKYISWRTKSFVRHETHPGGKLYTLIWRLFHPRAFLRPMGHVLARISSGIVRRSPAPFREPNENLPAGITVVIPSRDGRDLLEALFATLLPQAPEEIIVVDNGSTDGTADWLRREHPQVQIEYSEQPLSFAAAVNRGIVRARFARTCLLNNDMRLEPGFFTALSKPFDRQPGLFAATAQIFLPEHARREETGKAMYHRNKTGQFPVRCEMPIEGEDGTWVLYGSGGCTLYETAKLRALGCIGEQFTPAYVEDLDIGWRAWRRGWPTVFAANARVLHFHRSSTSKYFSERDLEDSLERNYIQFAAASNSRTLWREAIDRLNILAAKQEPVASAERALLRAFREPWRQPPAAAGDDTPLALCGGAVAVFPGVAAAGRQRIVIAAAYLPFPLAHGGAVRMFNLMREAARDFDLILLVFVDELATPAPELLAICAEIVLVRREGSHLLPSSLRPDVVEEHDSPEFRAALAATLRRWRPDIVQLEFTQMGLYAGACRPAKTILVEHDITVDLYGQLLMNSRKTDSVADGGGDGFVDGWRPRPAFALMKDKEDYDTRRQYEKWLTFEKDAWAKVDAVVTMSEKDRRTVNRPNAHVILNGVDLTRFHPCGEEPIGNRILFIGSFAHLPNLMALDFFLREAWPLIRDKAIFHIIAGQRHEYFLERYADRIKLDLNQRNIEIEGFVSDVRAAYRRAAIIVAPLVASAGTNIKIMEAMAMGKAIVSTSAGINGLDLQHGRDVLIANTGTGMAAAIERLIDHPEERKALEKTARSTAEQVYGWDRIGRVQADLYRTLAGKEKLHCRS
jgi:GT2 family glycosyltransferase/glycosyltransferase involved in cell wall biosynthesis